MFLNYLIIRKLGLASGIALAGSGIGQMLVAQLFVITEASLGLPETFIILAAIVLASITFALLFKAPKQSHPTTFPREGSIEQSILKENSCTAELSEPQPSIEEKRFLQSLIASYSCMLQNTAVVALFTHHVLFFMTISATQAFSVDMELSFGLSINDASLALSVIGASSIIGRIIFGQMLDTWPDKSILLTVLVCVLNSTVVMTSTYFTSYLGQMVFAAVFGSTFGAFGSSRQVIINRLYKKEMVTDILGFVLLAHGVAYVLGPEMIAVIFDACESYRLKNNYF